MTKQQFFDAYNEIEIRAYQIADFLRQHGRETLASQIDQEKLEKSNYFDLALKLACNGSGRAAVARFYDANIEAELEPEYKLLYQIQKEAILGILDGINPGELVMKINSYVDFGKDDAKFIYDKEMEYLKNPGLYEKELAKANAIFDAAATETPNTSARGPLSVDEIVDLLSAKESEVSDLPASETNNQSYQMAKAQYDNEQYTTAWYLMFGLANEGNAEAMNALGIMCLKGKGKAQDDAKALEWFRKAAIGGSSYAKEMIGKLDVSREADESETSNDSIRAPVTCIGQWTPAPTPETMIRNRLNGSVWINTESTDKQVFILNQNGVVSCIGVNSKTDEGTWTLSGGGLDLSLKFQSITYDLKVIDVNTNIGNALSGGRTFQVVLKRSIDHEY